MPVMLGSDQAFATRPMEVFADFFAAVADIEDPIEERIAAGEQALAAAKVNLDETVANLGRLIAEARGFVESGETLDWDRLVGVALDSEQAITKSDKQARKFARHLVVLLRKVDPKYVKRISPLIDRFNRDADWFVASVCDARWQIMVLRAEINKGDRGPEFSDPRELRRYLASLGT